MIIYQELLCSENENKSLFPFQDFPSALEDTNAVFHFALNLKSLLPRGHAYNAFTSH